MDNGAGMIVEMWPIDRIYPYEDPETGRRNPRKLTPQAVEKLAAIIADVGWQQCIVVEPEPHLGRIVVGHTRRLAAIKNGYQQVPVKVARGLTPEQIRSYRLADNRSQQESSWDDEERGLPVFCSIHCRQLNNGRAAGAIRHQRYLDRLAAQQGT